MGMWADTLLSVERSLWLRIIVWGACALLVGSATAIVAIRARGAGLLAALGLNLALIALPEIALAGLAWYHAAPRDVAGAARLDHALWLLLGFVLGLGVTGVMLGAAGWRLGRSPRWIGAGAAVATHAVALALLTLQVLPLISR